MGCHNVVAVLVKAHLGSLLVKRCDWYRVVSEVEYLDFGSVTCDQVLTIVIKGERLDRVGVLNINDLILLVHLVHTTDVLTDPRDG